MRTLKIARSASFVAPPYCPNCLADLDAPLVDVPNLPWPHCRACTETEANGPRTLLRAVVGTTLLVVIPALAIGLLLDGLNPSLEEAGRDRLSTIVAVPLTAYALTRMFVYLHRAARPDGSIRRGSGVLFARRNKEAVWIRFRNPLYAKLLVEANPGILS